MLGNLFKIAIVLAPIAMIIFYYVTIQQQKIDAEMKIEDARMEQKINEFERDFTRDKALKETYEAKAKEAEKEVTEMRQKQKEKEKKEQEYIQEFERALVEENQKKEEK